MIAGAARSDRRLVAAYVLCS